MRTREEIALPDNVLRELASLDAALAGESVDPDLVDLAQLSLMLHDERPQPSGSFAGELDTRAADGFRNAAARPHEALTAGRRMWIPALGAAASLTAATVLALSLTSGDEGRFRDATPTGDAAATIESPAVPSTGQGAPSATPRAAAPPAAKAQPESAPGGESRQLAPASPTLPAPASPAPTMTTPTLPAPAAGAVNRSVERGANLRLATTPRRLDDVAGGVVRVTDGVGGFVRSSAVDSRSGLGGGATFELQIPVRRLQTAIARLSQLASVRSRTESSLDVTEQVTFARNRVVALRAERRSLLRRLEGATSTEQTARLRARLRSIEVRLDRAKTARAQLRQRTAYSAVSVQIVTERPREGAAGPWTPRDALGDAARVLEVAAGVALVALAVLLPFALLALIAWPLGRSLRRRSREGALDAQGAGAAS